MCVCVLAVCIVQSQLHSLQTEELQKQHHCSIKETSKVCALYIIICVQIDGLYLSEHFMTELAHRCLGNGGSIAL